MAAREAKIRLAEAGQPCRRCGTPVEIQGHPEDWKPAPNQAYYFTEWLKCPSCLYQYNLQSSKVEIRAPKKKNSAIRLESPAGTM